MQANDPDKDLEKFNEQKEEDIKKKLPKSKLTIYLPESGLYWFVTMAMIILSIFVSEMIPRIISIPIALLSLGITLKKIIVVVPIETIEKDPNGYDAQVVANNLAASAEKREAGLTKNSMKNITRIDPSDDF